MSSHPSHRLSRQYVGQRTYAHTMPCRYAHEKQGAVLAAIEPGAWIGQHGPRSSSPSEPMQYLRHRLDSWARLQPLHEIN